MYCNCCGMRAGMLRKGEMSLLLHRTKENAYLHMAFESHNFTSCKTIPETWASKPRQWGPKSEKYGKPIL